MNEFIFPLMLVLLASLFQGTFGLGMKYMKPLAWEAWWVVHATVAMLLFPWTWAFLVVPRLCSVITHSPGDAVFRGALFGFLWGVGGIMFGVSVRYVGVSLTYGIVMGLAALMGSLVPLLQIKDVGSNPALPYVIAGMVLLVLGVAIAAYAGLRRDAVQAAENKKAADIQQGRAFRVGLVIAIICGVLSALLNVGFAGTEAIGAQAEKFGALPRNTSLARWVVVLAGAYVMNIGYAIFLLIKNRSCGSFSVAGGGKAYRWAIIAGLLWFAALGVYGQGAAIMGSLGPVIGWPMLLGLALIVSNVLAVWTGEWRGAAAPLKIMIAGVAVLIVACCLLGYSNRLQNQPAPQKTALLAP
jgi:L-rhamnose-H+ transport protein